MPVPSPLQQPGKSKRPLIIVLVLLVIIFAGLISVLVLQHSHKKSAQNVSNASPASSNAPSYSSGQQYARDSKREADLGSLQTQLEAFFQNTGYYPSLSDMNSASWRAVNMKTLDPSAMTDPLASCSPSSEGCLVAAPKAKAYAYTVTDSGGKSCETDDTQCAQYTLTATLEMKRNGSSTFVKSNLD